jgi:hypothetical protein
MARSRSTLFVQFPHNSHQTRFNMRTAASDNSVTFNIYANRSHTTGRHTAEGAGHYNVRRKPLMKIPLGLLQRPPKRVVTPRKCAKSLSKNI